MSIASRSQQNAQKAFDQVCQVDRKIQADYKIWCQKLPMLILRNGLSQATGFMLAKSSDDSDNSASGLLLRHIAEISGQVADAAEFHQVIIHAELPEYQRLTRQILQASVWYKRYSESLFEDSKSGEVPHE